MKCRLLEIDDNRVDGLPAFCQQFLLTAASGDDQYGFQHGDEAKSLLLRFITGAIAIDGASANEVSKLNANIVMNDLAKNQFGILIHSPDKALIEKTAAMQEYAKELKLYELKQKKGLITTAQLRSKPPLFGWQMSGRFDDELSTIITHCSFVSIWPQYWGEYGEHCIICTKDIKQFDGYLLERDIKVDKGGKV